MIKNYLKVAYRNIIRHKLFSLVNITGMAVGIAGFMLIMSYVNYEQNYDRFHNEPEKIFRLVTDVKLQDGGTMKTCLSSPMMAKYLKEYFVDIDAVSRINPTGEMLFSYQDKKIYEDNFTYVDSTFFDVFDFEPLLELKRGFLKSTKSLVLTETISKKYFGDSNPLGEIINVDKRDDYIVTGVISDVPENSHLNFDIIAYNSEERRFNGQNPGALSLYTYVKLSKEFKKNDVVADFEAFKEKYIDGGLAPLFQYDLQPLLSIHLHSDREHDMSKTNDIEQIYIFSIVAFLMVFIACINFMNLSTARSSLRSLEIGIRKVLGSTRKGIVFQYLSESVLLITVSVFIGVGLFFLFLPYLNELVSTNIESSILELIPLIILLVILVGLFAGSYPAFMMSGFSPISALRGKRGKSSSGAFVRKGLVIFQFTVAVGLLICAIIVNEQMYYVGNQNLGYSDEQVLIVPFRDDASHEQRDVLKTSFLQLASVKSASLSSGMPGYGFQQKAYSIPNAEGHGYIFHTVFVDEDFVETLKLKINSGRQFLKEYSTDKLSSILINEAAAKKLGWTEPLGKELLWYSNSNLEENRVVAKVVGVVDDFHFQSMYEKIEPLVIRFDESEARQLAIKLETGNLKATMSALEIIWNEICIDIPFETYFLDESFDKLYEAEQRLGNIFFIFTFLAMFISCLGIFGLSAFTVENKRKEIGVRKVLGASVGTIVLRLSKEFSVWVILANILGWPIAYFIMKDWLEKFAYRIDIQVAPFLVAALITFIVANSVLGFQTVKAAIVNPVDSLKDE